MVSGWFQTAPERWTEGRTESCPPFENVPIFFQPSRWMTRISCALVGITKYLPDECQTG